MVLHKRPGALKQVGGKYKFIFNYESIKNTEKINKKRDKKMKLKFRDKLIIAIVYDVLDVPMFFLNGVTFGIAGEVYDLMGVALGLYLIGPIGLLNAWELLDVSNTIELFPTMTVLVLYTHFRK